MATNIPKVHTGVIPRTVSKDFMDSFHKIMRASAEASMHMYNLKIAVFNMKSPEEQTLYLLTHGPIIEPKPYEDEIL